MNTRLTKQEVEAVENLIDNAGCNPVKATKRYHELYKEVRLIDLFVGTGTQGYANPPEKSDLVCLIDEVYNALEQNNIYYADAYMDKIKNGFLLMQKAD